MSSLASPSPSALEQELALEAALERAPRRSELVAVTFAARPTAAEALLAGSDGEAWAFAPASGFEVSSLGVVRALEASGPERFEAVHHQAERLFSEIGAVGADAEAEPVRLFGGFAFQSGRTESPLWRSFGEAKFLLPRLTYVRRGDQATLTVVLERRDAETKAGRALAAAELARAQARLGSPLASPPALSPVTPPPRSDAGALEEWTARVEAIRSAIERRELEKVVLARRVEFALPAPDPANVLARLRTQAPECTRFLLRVGSRAFVGAAPERLVRKSGLELETEAVAGSIKAGATSELARLLESQKDLSEHEMVVRGIEQALSEICAAFKKPPRPEFHRLRHVTHLRTPIRARLSGAHHVLSLVARLHPTPAVGGLPRSAALDWIRANEPDERGWYAGPLGWFDAAGDGEFVVGLRSGVLEPARAHLYVGAGIVRDSKPAEEFAETEWKLAGLAGALGVTS